MAFEILEVLEIFAYGFIGWRYIFSSSFRRQTHAHWRSESWITIVLEIMLSAFGIFLTLLPVGLLAVYMY